MISNGLAMLSVLLEKAQQPTQRFLVVVMLLAFDDDLERRRSVAACFVGGDADLFTAEDELIATLLREVLFAEEVFASVKMLLRVVFILARNAIGDSILKLMKALAKLLNRRSRRTLISRTLPMMFCFFASAA
jgi:hypothetical protein